MKALLAHVPYEHRGGEDVHVDALEKAYSRLGIQTIRHLRQANASLGAAARSLLPGQPGGNDGDDSLARLLDDPTLDFVHVHNAFPTLGPRFYRALIRRRLPALQTIHNHRFYCTNGLALRDGRICKDCQGATVAWRPMIHDCNGNRAKTAYHSAALTEMRVGRLYERAIQRFVAPSPYIVRELERSGFAPERITLLPHPISIAPAVDPAAIVRRDVALYAGRLSPEKGVATLLAAAALRPAIRFEIAGTGPMLAEVASAAARLPNLTVLGQITRDDLEQRLRAAAVTVMPSICEESFGMLAAEALVAGRRAIVSDLESTRWFSEDGLAGSRARPGDAADLARAITDALQVGDPPPAAVQAARARFGVEAFDARLRATVDRLLAEARA